MSGQSAADTRQDGEEKKTIIKTRREITKVMLNWNVHQNNYTENVEQDYSESEAFAEKVEQDCSESEAFAKAFTTQTGEQMLLKMFQLI